MYQTNNALIVILLNGISKLLLRHSQGGYESADRSIEVEDGCIMQEVLFSSNSYTGPFCLNSGRVSTLTLNFRENLQNQQT